MNKVIFTGKLTTPPIPLSDVNYSDMVDFLIQRGKVELQVICQGDVALDAMKHRKGDLLTVTGKFGCDAYEDIAGDIYILADSLEAL